MDASPNIFHRVLPMFIDAKKSIKWGDCFFKFSPFVLILSSSPVPASECGVLRLQTHCNLGATVTENTCPTKTGLGLKSIIALPTGTRVWLESIETPRTSKRYQIICLNKSSTIQKIQIASTDFPWLVPVGLQSCSTWLDNRLMCKQSDNQHEALLCVAVPKVAPANQPVQFRTSVIVRGPKQRLLDEHYNWADLVKPNIDLCRQLLNTNQSITLNWTLETSGKVSHSSIAESGIDKQFSGCALEALENTGFPAVIHDMRLTASF